MGILSKYFNERKRTEEISAVYKDGVTMVLTPLLILSHMSQKNKALAHKTMSWLKEEVIKHQENELPTIYSAYKQDPEILKLIEMADNIDFYDEDDMRRYAHIIKQIGRLIQKKEKVNILLCKPYSLYYTILLRDGPPLGELIVILGIMTLSSIMIVNLLLIFKIDVADNSNKKCN